MKKLYRSNCDRKLFGVCGGLAEYLNLDSSIIRILCTLLILAGGSGFLLYIILAFVIPEDPENIKVITNNKKLYRSKTDRKISGICGGLAKYFNVDSNMIRLIWIASILFLGSGLLAYFILIFVIPEE